MLYATGLVAGGSLGGVAIAFVAFFGDRILHMEKPQLLDFLDMGTKFFPAFKNGVGGQILCAAVFAGLCFLLVRNARKDIAS
jgi:hypothetical protein